MSVLWAVLVSSLVIVGSLCLIGLLAVLIMSAAEWIQDRR